MKIKDMCVSIKPPFYLLRLVKKMSKINASKKIFLFNFQSMKYLMMKRLQIIDQQI